jgi:membrane carboxypeptidase/penicillin-binding protein
MELGEGGVVDMAKQLRHHHAGAAVSVHRARLRRRVAPRDDRRPTRPSPTSAGACRPRRSCAWRRWTVELVFEAKPERVHVLAREEAWLMVDMIKDVVHARLRLQRRVEFRVPDPRGRQDRARPTTTPTSGTSASPPISSPASGSGFDQPKEIMGNAQGGRLAAPAWTSFMREVYERKPAPPDWPRPPGIIAVPIDPATGLRAGPGCLSDSVRRALPCRHRAAPGVSPAGLDLVSPW